MDPREQLVTLMLLVLGQCGRRDNGDHDLRQQVRVA